MNTDRQIGMGGEGPIPSLAIDAFARRHGIDDPDDFERLALIIRVLDDDYREKRKPRPPDGPEMICLADIDAVRDLLRRAGLKPGDPKPDFEAIKRRQLAARTADQDGEEE